jgi:hypothetical protein
MGHPNLNENRSEFDFVKFSPNKLGQAHNSYGLGRPYIRLSYIFLKLRQAFLFLF